MSLYLSLTFKFIYCFSFNILLISSFSDNQSLEIYASNKSIIINNTYSSNSYNNFQNGLLGSNLKLNVNLGNYSSSCTQDIHCATYKGAYGKCCDDNCIYNQTVCPGM